MGADIWKWIICAGAAIFVMGLLLGMMLRSIHRDNDRFRECVRNGGDPELYDEHDPY